MRVVIVAAPLSARSGVYRSTTELVAAARARGLDWRAELGMRADAPGTPVRGAAGITEWKADAHGLRVRAEIRRAVSRAIQAADVVITMTPQSDLAVSGLVRSSRAVHVAWVRGLPWPGRNEQTPVRRGQLWAASRWALGRADAVWATTPLLQREIRSVGRAAVVPAGIPLRPRMHDGIESGPLIFAGRLSVEKNPQLVVDVARACGRTTRIAGDGPLAARLRATATDHVALTGWADPDELWRVPGTFVCPSFREAFGRSAVEAAGTGHPVVLSSRTGVAPLLIRDSDLADRFVLPPDALDRWCDAVRSLDADPALRRRLSDHVSHNARLLSTESSLDAALSALEPLLRRNP